ncbi:SDR family oxidoreductase [Paenibacillus oryzisoli]|uniref:SDR family NAD(P)-dependent oxidoreductase n=1 Tax=Paenibacillus oryzisoli TaxID=1850517 RepID=UPI003D28D6EA
MTKEAKTGGEMVKTALVTGGSRGIGRGIALILAECGYDLAISHWNDEENAKVTAAMIQRSFGRRCEVFEGNLEAEKEPGRLAEDVIRAFGRIDVLVNNAGITIFGSIEHIDIAQTNRLLHLDFRAPLLLMQAFSKHMIEQGVRGSIVNITSVRAERAYPGDAIYGGVKAALARATASIALDLSAHGIRVNCVAPGAIKANDTGAENFNLINPGVPLNRSGTPEDIGRAVAWLVSDAASYITGTTLRVDGGLILPGTPH